MTDTKQKPKKRLAVTDLRDRVESTLAQIKPFDGSIPDDMIEWIDEQLRDPKKPLAKLFARSGLDSGNFGHWKLLLQILAAESHYAETRGSRSSPAWSDKKEYELLIEANKYKLKVDKGDKRKVTYAEIAQGIHRLPCFVLTSGKYVGQRPAASTLETRLSNTVQKWKRILANPIERRDYEFPGVEVGHWIEDEDGKRPVFEAAPAEGMSWADRVEGLIDYLED